ncbi:MAG: hypothetical protein JST82_00200 [Bacteroidetes bacterium]|nr:hypothetical protein [Bacteroidota bacterium]
MKKAILIGLLFTATQSHANPDTVAQHTNEKRPLVLEYTILDFPFATYAGKTVNCTIADPNAQVSLFKGMQYQSMQQATQISTGIAQTVNWGVTQIPILKKHKIWKRVFNFTLAGVLDIGVIGNYYGAGWAHEEFHRNAMVVNYTNSFNPLTVNKREGLTSNGLASVAYVLDTNLVLLKKNNNPGLVRLEAAGMEGQVYGISRMQQQDFFYDSRLPNFLYYIFSAQNVHQYLKVCTNRDELTKKTEEQMANEGSKQELRDFCGLDPAAWAYDLWHPNEAYAARGLNPYGNGYDRYIKGSDLTDEQISWLKKQARLSSLNYFGLIDFRISELFFKKNKGLKTFRAALAGRYYPTSFGNSIGIDLMTSISKYNIFVSPHLNQNLSHNFPGIEAMLFEYPVKMGNQKFLATVDVIADLQPKDQSFFTATGAFTGYANIMLKWKANKFIYPYIGVSGKTKGWVRGNPFLDDKMGFEFGLSARFNYKY